MSSFVATEAKRILLRYGAPIAVLETVDEEKRIAFAREVAKTELSGREDKVRSLLVSNGFLSKGKT